MSPIKTFTAASRRERLERERRSAYALNLPKHS
jgi:hypothetical protein